MIVVDACLLIAHLDTSDALHERAGSVLVDVADHELVASPITLAEVLVRPARIDRLDTARAALRELGVAEAGLGQDVSVRLARIRAATGSKLPDCCVLLAAEQVAASGIATLDDRLAAQAKKLGWAVTTE